MPIPSDPSDTANAACVWNTQAALWLAGMWALLMSRPFGSEREVRRHRRPATARPPWGSPPRTGWGDRWARPSLRGHALDPGVDDVRGRLGDLGDPLPVHQGGRGRGRAAGVPRLGAGRARRRPAARDLLAGRPAGHRPGPAPVDRRLRRVRAPPAVPADR